VERIRGVSGVSSYDGMTNSEDSKLCYGLSGKHCEMLLYAFR
jgi:hypothetical protein